MSAVNNIYYDYFRPLAMVCLVLAEHVNEEAWTAILNKANEEIEIGRVIDHVKPRGMGGAISRKFNIAHLQLLGGLENIKKGSKHTDYRSQQLKNRLQEISTLYKKAY